MERVSIIGDIGGSHLLGYSFHHNSHPFHMPVVGVERLEVDILGYCSSSMYEAWIQGGFDFRNSMFVVHLEEDMDLSDLPNQTD